MQENLTGIDIQYERILDGRKHFPTIKFVNGDASKMQFPNDVFDIVTESTMFVQLTDNQLSCSIANEMIRVTKPNGYIMLVDWRYSKPWDKNYRGLSLKRIRDIFCVGSETKIFGIYKGALIPPIGRFLSKRIPFLYFMVHAFSPVLVGQITVVLQKVSKDYKKYYDIKGDNRNSLLRSKEV